MNGQSTLFFHGAKQTYWLELANAMNTPYYMGVRVCVSYLIIKQNKAFQNLKSL